MFKKCMFYDFLLKPVESGAPCYSDFCGPHIFEVCIFGSFTLQLSQHGFHHLSGLLDGFIKQNYIFRQYACLLLNLDFLLNKIIKIHTMVIFRSIRCKYWNSCMISWISEDLRIEVGSVKRKAKVSCYVTTEQVG